MPGLACTGALRANEERVGEHTGREAGLFGRAWHPAALRQQVTFSNGEGRAEQLLPVTFLQTPAEPVAVTSVLLALGTQEGRAGSEI